MSLYNHHSFVFHLLNLKICFRSSISLKQLFVHFFNHDIGFSFVQLEYRYIKAEIYIVAIGVAIAIMTMRM